MTSTIRILPAVTLAVMIATPSLGDQLPRRERPRDNEQRGPEVTERFSKTLKLARGGTLDLSNVAGDVVVTGRGGNDLQVDALKRVRSRLDGDAKAQLDAIQIEILELTNRVEVRTSYPNLRPRNVNGAVDYTVAVPQDANVIIKSVSGTVRVTNVRGELRAQSVSGDVIATDAPRVAALRSVSGNVQLTNGASETSLGVNTVSGDLTLRGVKVRALDAGSVSGDLRMDGVESQRVTAKSVSGDIEYGGPLARNGRYEFSAHSGGIMLNLSGGMGFDVEASTFSGDVRSDYALTLRGTDNTLARPALRPRRDRLAGPVGPGGQGRRVRTLRGSFGDGSASIELQSFSGDIAIIKRN
jgi:hypothetical protein